MEMMSERGTGVGIKSYCTSSLGVGTIRLRTTGWKSCARGGLAVAQ
jgi:hypothetical protein